MILAQVWHFFGHLQQQIMLQPNVLGETEELITNIPNLHLFKV